MSTPVASQVWEIQKALSLSKSELAQVLRVSRRTLDDWQGTLEPSAANATRIRQVLRLIGGAGASSTIPLFPRFVSHGTKPEGTAPLELLSVETLDEEATLDALRRAKAVGDGIRRWSRELRERRRAAGFQELDAEQRKANLALNVALMKWPRE